MDMDYEDRGGPAMPWGWFTACAIVLWLLYVL
jgi:hypothetical protein